MCLLHFREVRKPCVMIDGQTCAAASRPQCVSVAAILVVAMMEEKEDASFMCCVGLHKTVFCCIR